MQQIQSTDIGVRSDTRSSYEMLRSSRGVAPPSSAGSASALVKHDRDSRTSELTSATSGPWLIYSDASEILPADFHDLELRYLESLRKREVSPTMDFAVPPNSTVPEFDHYTRIRDKRDLKNEALRLFSLATVVEMEAGMKNDFSIGLEALIGKNGSVALSVIEELIIEEKVPFTIAADALRYIGNYESVGFVAARRRMLEACLLESRFVLVRDGAAAGLSYLDDPRSIPALKTAIDKETYAELKEDLVEVLRLLQETRMEQQTL